VTSIVCTLLLRCCSLFCCGLQFCVVLSVLLFYLFCLGVVGALFHGH
jgi:hypothetical protein